MLSSEAPSILADGAVTGPEERVAPGTHLFEGSHQGRIPFGGPAADDKAVLVKDTVDVSSQGLWVLCELSTVFRWSRSA